MNQYYLKRVTTPQWMLDDILDDHKIWLLNKRYGKKAQFAFKICEGLDFRRANLQKANLAGGQFCDCNFKGADFRGADLEAAMFLNIKNIDKLNSPILGFGDPFNSKLQNYIILGKELYVLYDNESCQTVKSAKEEINRNVHNKKTPEEKEILLLTLDQAIKDFYEKYPGEKPWIKFTTRLKTLAFSLFVFAR